jgi:hypothetical protein
MTVNFRKQENSQPPTDKKVAMPVGTSMIMSMDKFMFDKRDTNCTRCRNGYTSTLPKSVDGKIYSVAVICTCVPYFLDNDGKGNGTVVYKGRKENWLNFTRPEKEISDELIRQGIVSREQNRQDSNKKALDAGGKDADEVRAQQNAQRAPQKQMYQSKDGHWFFVDSATARKWGLIISDVANPVINPDKPNEEGPAPAQQQGKRQETDEEFLERTTGQAIDNSDPTYISPETAAAIEASRVAKPVAKPVAKAQTSAPATQATGAPKKGRGRPAGAKNKPKV